MKRKADKMKDFQIRGIVKRIRVLNRVLSIITLCSIDEAWDEAKVRFYDGIPKKVRDDLLGRVVDITVELNGSGNDGVYRQTIKTSDSTFFSKESYDLIKRINQHFVKNY